MVLWLSSQMIAKKRRDPKISPFNFHISALVRRYATLILDSLNIFSLRAFLALSHGEANALAFNKGFKT